MTRTSTDLAEWLGRHGLDRHARTFAENNIDFSVLPDLTEDDLEKLGISLGHRKKLLRAIEAITAARQPSGTTTAAANIPTPSTPLEQYREAEFRQITVMFCDLVGSMQLSEKLDPEDVQRLINAYRGECSAATSRYGGEVARYFGDGVMVFFGYPHAHEDDAVRAVHAALEIVSGVPKISGPVTLASRVGICSGPVVVGEIGNSTTPKSMDAVGETPNLAARLQTLAAANTVLISEFNETTRIGNFRSSGPWAAGAQRRKRTCTCLPRACGEEHLKSVRGCACRVSHSARWTFKRTELAARQVGESQRG